MQSARSRLKPGLSFASLCLVACQGESVPESREASPPEVRTPEPNRAVAASSTRDRAGAESERAGDRSGTQAWLDELLTPRRAGPYAPRDECKDVPGATRFRIALAEAVRERDAGAVVALAVPDVNLGFGGDAGRASLRSNLQAEAGELFGELAQVLRLGCDVNSQGGLTMPWYFAQSGPADPYRAMLVTGVGVPLREGPSEDADVERRISWDFVKLISPLDPDSEFQHVLADDGMEGFVSRGDLRSLLDYRLLAVQTPQGWRISSIVAGD